jgi:hypothetical protein
MPDSVEMPAPVSATMRVEVCTQRRTRSTVFFMRVLCGAILQKF